MTNLRKKIYKLFSINFIKKSLSPLVCKITKRPDYFNEIYFWYSHLAKKDKQSYSNILLDPQRRKELFPGKLLPYIERIRTEEGCCPKLFEIGSGPTSSLAWGVDHKLFQIVAIDPLADKYCALMEKHNYSYPIKPIKCKGEEVLKLFPRESFDIIYSRNALDHAESPQECIDNAYNLLKQRGIIFLEGAIKEGTHQKWLGLHQHDLLPRDGQLLHYNKDGILTNLTRDLKLKCVYQEKKGNSPGDWYTIIFQKT